MFGFQWPWVSRKSADAKFDKMQDFYSGLSEANVKSLDTILNQKDRLRTKLNDANARLARIAALETPNCAHIGKKMARIARGEAE